MLIGRDALGKTVLGFPILLDVLARALDEMAGEFDALRFSQRGDLVFRKFRPEQGEQGAERFGNSAVRCGREQNHVAGGRGREVFQEFVALVLVAVQAGGGRRAVRLVHDHEVGAVLEEIGALPVALHIINADDLEGVVAVNTPTTTRYSAFKLVHRAGADDHRVQAELFAEFLLPLLTKVGRADYAEAFDFAAIQHLAHDEQPLDRLAHAYVVGDEHPHGVEAQGHEQRDELISARANGHAPQRTQRRRPFTQREACRLPEQVRARDVGKVFGRGRWEFCRAHSFLRERVAEQIRELLVNSDSLVRRAGEGPQDVDVLRVARQ